MIALALAIGAMVNWTDGTTGQVFCGTLLSVHDRFGLRAVILPAIQPQWLITVPLDSVSEGCPASQRR